MQRLPLRRNAAEEGGCLIKRKPNKKKKKERRKAKRRKGRRKQRVNRGRKGGWIREPLAGWDSIPRNGRIWLANSRKRKPTGVAGGGVGTTSACVCPDAEAANGITRTSRTSNAAPFARQPHDELTIDRIDTAGPRAPPPANAKPNLLFHPINEFFPYQGRNREFIRARVYLCACVCVRSLALRRILRSYSWVIFKLCGVFRTRSHKSLRALRSSAVFRWLPSFGLAIALSAGKKKEMTGGCHFHANAIFFF